MRKLSEQTKYKVVTECNANYDGVFFYGVKTTGIFCRPSCKSKAPLEKNIVFFNDIFEAYNSGFRPCKRCRPDLLEEQDKQILKIIDNAKKTFDLNYKNSISIKKLSKCLGINEFYFMKVFKKQYGHTPREYVTKIRLEKSKELLINSGKSITEIAYCVGFNSLSSFYDNFKKHMDITPKQYRKMKGGTNYEEVNNK